MSNIFWTTANERERVRLEIERQWQGWSWGDIIREQLSQPSTVVHEPKPVIEPIPPGPYVEPRFDPKPATPEPMGKEIVVAEFEDQRYTRFEPATPEPPEWKEPFDPNATMYPSDFVVSPHVFVRKAHDVSDCHYCGVSRFGPMACQPCPGGTIGNPPPSPLDRALEAFTARRKAKRGEAVPAYLEYAGGKGWRAKGDDGKGMWGTFATTPERAIQRGWQVKRNAEAQAEAAGMTEPKAKEIVEDQAKAVSRAMSTPLPHDPPMSARLMPWKGKADGQ